MNKPDREILIDCLVNRYEWYCHDDTPKGDEPTEEQYLEQLKQMTYEQLIKETVTGGKETDAETLEEFMERWS